MYDNYAKFGLINYGRQVVDQIYFEIQNQMFIEYFAFFLIGNERKIVSMYVCLSTF